MRIKKRYVAAGLVATVLTLTVVAVATETPDQRDARTARPEATAVAQRKAHATSQAVPTPVNYGALRGQLLAPLGALIVATRERNEAGIARQLYAFEAAADRVLPAIEGDMSINANRLHSVIVNTREAAARRDLASLEGQRRWLLEVR